MKNSADAERDFVLGMVEGECPCCFPTWEYEGVDVQDLWGWIDKYSAHDVIDIVRSQDEVSH